MLRAFFRAAAKVSPRSRRTLGGNSPKWDIISAVCEPRLGFPPEVLVSAPGPVTHIHAPFRARRFDQSFACYAVSGNAPGLTGL